METLASAKPASPETEPELRLLLERDRRGDWRRWRMAAIVSAVVHAILLIVLLLMPEGESRLYEERQPRLEIVHLITPTDLTQKDPNKGKVSKEISIANIPAPAAVKTPAPAPPPRQAASTPPPPPVARTQPKPEFVEPPKIEPPKTQTDSQSDQVAKLNAPPPLPPPTEQPKIVFQNAAPPPPPPGSGQGRAGSAIAVPNPSVAAAIHELATGGAVTGRQSVGDNGTGMGGAELTLPSSPGSLPANIELRSDPQGVDFRPYLIQVLAAVRRNWFAVYPAAARAGLRGQVALEFKIVKQGTVAKVVFSGQSGSKPLDEAAVAAISASNPLPPLPREFKGDSIVLEMTFLYNVKR